MMDYRVVTADSAGELSAQVRTYISRGWKPWGGVAIAHTGDSRPYVVFSQAMTSEETNVSRPTTKTDAFGIRYVEATPSDVVSELMTPAKITLEEWNKQSE